MPVLTFAISLVISLATIPLLIRIGHRSGRLAIPQEDRWHRRPVPNWGGVAIFLAFLGGILISVILSGDWQTVRWGMLAGSVIVFLLGVYDDFRPLTPQTKLVGQILAAAVVIYQGFTTQFFSPRLQDELIAQIPNVVVTFIWLVGITNAINLLDNMDGLAGGLALITAGILSYFFWQAGNQSLLLISMALAGSVLGFLFFNFPPASIFMGDAGSMFLGFTLALLAIARQPQASNVFAVMGVPTLLFLLPILDTLLVTFTRLLRGQSPAQGGRDHTSHRLIAFGLSERQAVVVLYLVGVISGVVAAALESLNYWYSLVLVPVLVLSLALMTAYLGGLKVVFAPATPSRHGPITRIMLELTYKRRVLEVILDFVLFAVAYYLAFLISFGVTMGSDRLALFLSSLPIAVGAAYLANFVFGVYRGVWRYVGVDDFVRFLKAALGSSVLVLLATALIYPRQDYPALIPILFGVFLFLGLAATRASFRVLDQLSIRQSSDQDARVVIFGAGDGGEVALRWILVNPQLGYRVVGFLDEDALKAGRQIHGVDILGGIEQLERLLGAELVDGVIMAEDAQEANATIDELIEICRAHRAWVRSMRLEFELVEPGENLQI